MPWTIALQRIVLWLLGLITSYTMGGSMFLLPPAERFSGAWTAAHKGGTRR